jgi:hypothetical protein
VMVYPAAANMPAMYSPSLVLWEQPHVLRYTDWVPGMKLSLWGASSGVRRLRGRSARGKTALLGDGWAWPAPAQSSMSSIMS